jgi:enamine deaminase RidA (YjgF/YER057c/UK114 family)
MPQPETPESRLAAMGVTLPPAPRPVAAYVPFVRTGNLVFVSGQIPMKDGALMTTGRVPDQVDLATAVACARQCALNGLAVVRDAAGSLDRVCRVVRLGVFVAAEPGFHDEPKVGNGASELMVQVFGEAGRHARAAVGASDLPLGAPVEVEFVFEVE